MINKYCFICNLPKKECIICGNIDASYCTIHSNNYIYLDNSVYCIKCYIKKKSN